MRRLANGTQVAALPTPAAAIGTPGYGSNGNPAAGQEASIFDADQYNRIQEELMAFLTRAGIAPSGTVNDQVLTACFALFGGDAEFGPTSGRVDLPGGLKLKYGESTFPNSGNRTSSRSIAFPVAFPTACVLALALPRGPANSTAGFYPACAIISRTPTGFDAVADVLGDGVVFNQAVPFDWFCLGR